MKRHAERERGASLVEFALVLPVFMALVLGMFTGGIAYNRKISLTNAAREASRYGATLPVSGNLTTWATAVADVTQDNATGDLDSGVAGRSICVAYVHPDGTTAGTANDQNFRLLRTSGSDATSNGLSATCFADGRASSERRVQVLVQRNSDLETLFFTWTLTLTGRSVTRFEATS